PIQASGRRLSATVAVWARHSRSPTTCSTSRAIRRRSAKPPVRTRPPIRQRWSACSDPRLRGGGSKTSLARRRPRWAPSAAMQTCSKPRRASLPHAPLEDGGNVAAKSHAAHLVQLGGLEPPTSWSTAKRSNQLSYSCTHRRKRPQRRSAVLL